MVIVLVHKSIQRIHTPHMKVRNGSRPPMLNTASCLHCMGWSHPQYLLARADLVPSPDDGLNSYNSPQLSVEVGVTSINKARLKGNCLEYEPAQLFSDMQVYDTVSSICAFGW
jgi:hypothetical protein